jgi:YHS domain-containing protein
MKNIKRIAVIAMVAAICAAAGAAHAGDTNTVQTKPYPLDTCLVCGMKLGDMGKPYSFVYKGQEIKVCDKSEKADFDKTPDQYLEKLADAEAKMKK